MKTRIQSGVDWLDRLLPEGMPIPSSTLISGPGGTGKPLVEFAFVSAWLKAGGSVIGIPLQYPSGELVKSSMKKLYGMDLADYQGKVAYIHFDPTLAGYRRENDNSVRANMVRPGIWHKAIAEAERMVSEEGPGTMVFGSAMNLLLFSEVYRDEILKTMRESLENDKSRTYVFAVSTSAFAEEIHQLEEVVDNLMFTRMEKPMHLFFRISRMSGVRFSAEEKTVPIPPGMLKEINQIANSTRKRRFSEIKRIK